MAPTTGMPAAMKPPNTTTMTSRLTGSAMPSPVRRSVSTWPVIWLTSCEVPPTWPRAPGRSRTMACSSAVTADSVLRWAALDRPGFVSTTVRKSPRDGSPCATRDLAAADVGPPGTTKGLATCWTPPTWRSASECRSTVPATAGEVRSTPVTCSIVAGPLVAASETGSRPVRASPGTVGSPEVSRWNSESPPRAPAAAAKHRTTTTSHRPRTRQGWRPTMVPIRASRVGWAGDVVRGGDAGEGVGVTRDSLPAVSTADDALFATAHREGAAGVDASASVMPPLAVRMRPQSLEEVRGQGDVLRPGSPLRRLIEGYAGPAGPLSAILWGPPGTAKTTLAHLVATNAGRKFVELSAVTAGVKDVRAVMDAAARERDLYDRQTVLFLDEIHRFTKAQQDALLPGVENRLVVLVAATTENPSFSVIAPLLSRSVLVTLTPLDDDEIADLVDAAVADERGLAGGFSLDDDARAHLVRIAGGDARRALTALEAAAGVALDTEPLAEETDDHPVKIALTHTEQAVAQAAVRYDRAGDQHYDVASALIKSMRGSDVDAALHYLARMLEAGEDPRFIARRIVISASEDVGMGDPTALQTAVAAMHAVAQIGMPEARIILAQAVVHNAMAPKSNAAYLGVNAAIADVRAGRGGPVPPHLRGSGYAGAERLGHGAGYVYAHDEPDGVAKQQYLPDDLEGAVAYYRPTDRGFEERLRA